MTAAELAIRIDSAATRLLDVRAPSAFDNAGGIRAAATCGTEAIVRPFAAGERRRS